MPEGFDRCLTHSLAIICRDHLLCGSPSHGPGTLAYLRCRRRTLLFVWVRHRKVREDSRKIATTPSLREIEDETTLDEILASERAVIYKHSTSCPVSAIVIDEVLRFADRHSSWPVHVVQVIEHRDLSDAVAEQLGVRHESPQALVLRDGRCIWHTSHGGITAHRLGQHLA